MRAIPRPDRLLAVDRRRWRRKLLHPPLLEQPLRRLLVQLPAGRVTTYGDLARALGLVTASRWVAVWAKDHPHEAGCPCFRIVRATGEVVGCAAGTADQQAEMLRSDRVPMSESRVDLGTSRFTGFRGSQPLSRLVNLQEEMAGAVLLSPLVRWHDRVSAVDISTSAPGRAVAAYVIVHLPTASVEWSMTLDGRLDFPYIPSLLSFRELPLLLRLLDRVARRGRLVAPLVVDGSGILHPRRCGLAAQLGVALDWPTIGVTKKRLCGTFQPSQGSVDRPRRVYLDGQPVGVAVLPPSGTRRPLFFSPGHRTDLSDCDRAGASLLGTRRLPTPIYWADRISRQQAVLGRTVAGSDLPAD